MNMFKHIVDFAGDTFTVILNMEVDFDPRTDATIENQILAYAQVEAFRRVGTLVWWLPKRKGVLLEDLFDYLDRVTVPFKQVAFAASDDYAELLESMPSVQDAEIVYKLDPIEVVGMLRDYLNHETSEARFRDLATQAFDRWGIKL